MNIDERGIFACQCGDSHYLDVRVIGDGESASVIVTDWPASLWQRIRRLFRREACQYEILLTEEQMGELRDVLEVIRRKMYDEREQLALSERAMVRSILTRARKRNNADG